MATNDRSKGQHLRPEARPFRFSKLLPSQQRAFESIARDLIEAVSHLRKEARSAAHREAALTETGPHYRRFSPNNTVFLTGGRGSGKSSLMFSLFETLAHGHSGENSRPETPIKTDGKQKEPSTKAHIDRRGDEIIGELEDIASRVILLDILDLEPLAEPTNLLASLLIRIREAVRLHRPFPTEGTLYPGRRLGDDPMEELRRLEEDAILTWSTNFPQRGFELDPDTLIAEIRRPEEARLDFNNRVSQALRRLGTELMHINRLPGPPLFLLPVDDFDMNPSRSIEILKLLRFVQVPQLFVLVLGDIHIAEFIFQLYISGQLARSASADRGSNLLSLPTDRVRALAGNIAANALRKLVPPAQRIELEPMPVQDALDYEPGTPTLDSLEEPGEKQPTLRAKLVDLRVTVSTASCLPPRPGKPERQQFLACRNVDTLADMMTARQFWKNSTTFARWVGGSDPLVYPACALLNSPPRQVADLWFEISNVIEATAELPEPKEPDAKVSEENRERRRRRLEKFVALLGRQVVSAADEDPTLSPEEKLVLRDAVRQQFEGHTELVTRGIEPAHREPGPTLYTKVDEMPSATVRVRVFNDFDFRPKVRREEQESPPRHEGLPRDARRNEFRVSDQVPASLLLLHDILVWNDQWGLLGEPLVPAWGDGGSTGLGETGIDRLNTAFDDSKYRCPWPTPSWQSFWEFSLLRGAWNHVWRLCKTYLETERRPTFTGGAKPPCSIGEWLLYRWIGSCTAALLPPRNWNPAQADGAPSTLTVEDFMLLAKMLGVGNELDDQADEEDPPKFAKDICDEFLLNQENSLSEEDTLLKEASTIRGKLDVISRSAPDPDEEVDWRVIVRALRSLRDEVGQVKGDDWEWYPPSDRRARIVRDWVTDAYWLCLLHGIDDVVEESWKRPTFVRRALGNMARRCFGVKDIARIARIKKDQLDRIVIEVETRTKELRDGKKSREDFAKSLLEAVEGLADLSGAKSEALKQQQREDFTKSLLDAVEKLASISGASSGASTQPEAVPTATQAKPTTTPTGMPPSPAAT
ncbi:MAG: hypothetical protein HY816_08010 [Candidatus Wallbacteria bacterium]|nr:hypothetical protein [Candidatus Wallbacteria bacterium]